MTGGGPRAASDEGGRMEGKKPPRRRKYRECARADGNCTVCPLRCGKADCKGRNISGIEWWRLKKNIGQLELSQETGVSIRTIQGIECGKSDTGNLSIKSAIKISRYMHIRPEQLLEFDY